MEAILHLCQHGDDNRDHSRFRELLDQAKQQQDLDEQMNNDPSNNNNNKRQKRVDLNSFIDGRTLLHFVVDRSMVNFVRELVAGAGKDAGFCAVDATDRRHSTAMIDACMHGNLEIARILIADGNADLTISNMEGMSVLHCCCGAGSAMLMEFLLESLKQQQAEAIRKEEEEEEEDEEEEEQEKGGGGGGGGGAVAAEVNPQPPRCPRPLDVVVKSVTGLGNTLFHNVKSRGVVETITTQLRLERKLLEFLFRQVNKEGRTPLHVAALWWRWSAIRAMVASEAEFGYGGGNSWFNRVDSTGRTALHLAIAFPLMTFRAELNPLLTVRALLLNNDVPDDLLEDIAGLNNMRGDEQWMEVDVNKGITKRSPPSPFLTVRRV